MIAECAYLDLRSNWCRGGQYGQVAGGLGLGVLFQPLPGAPGPGSLALWERGKLKKSTVKYHSRNVAKPPLIGLREILNFHEHPKPPAGRIVLIPPCPGLKFQRLWWSFREYRPPVRGAGRFADRGHFFPT